ncbi:MAG: hypothetical protein QNI90_13350 [Dinoroseobacter sp.]|nr:hypothetical protein [Dinoroseobacter sp.]
MTASAAAPIEDFLEAITAQLDKTQDSLRLKAVNRPLTFALKDFTIDLSVFVEMDPDGIVRLRPSGPNEAGASTIHIGFTTITRTMIEENTISMELAQSPGLEEAELAPEESLRLQRLGVRNTAQLDRLRAQLGDEGVARFSGVDPGRLRQALQVNRGGVDFVDIGAGRRARANPEGEPPATVPIRPGQQRLRLRGANLNGGGQQPARLSFNGQHLPIRASSFSHIDIDLPDERAPGANRLDVELADGRIQSFDLVEANAANPTPREDDRWSSRAPEEPEA